MDSRCNGLPLRWTPAPMSVLLGSAAATYHPGFRALNLSKATQMCKNFESCAKLLKLSDKVTLTRAFTARWKNRPVIVFFHRVSPIPFF